VLRTISPETGEKRFTGFRLNPATTPRQIDLTTQFDEVQKGIYRFEGDQLVLCVNQAADGDRPSDFAAPAGSKNKLVTLRMVARSPKPEPVPTVAQPAEPAPRVKTEAEKAREREELVRQMLVGSWTWTDDKGSITTVLRPDGTFVSTRQWSKAMKRLFEGQTSSSSGRWTYSSGLLRANILSSDQRKLAGQTVFGKIQSIGDTTMVAQDASGQLRRYQKLR
jgi:hypothetical protein